MLKEHGEKVAAETRAEIERAMSELRDALKTDDADVIKKKMELLTTASHKLAEEMYKATSAPGGGASVPPEAQTDRGAADAGAEGKKKDDDVIDAEYEVKE
jgi:molecular chaperone DnaK